MVFCLLFRLSVCAYLVSVLVSLRTGCVKTMYYLLGRLGKSLLQEVSAFKIHIQILQTDLHTFLLRIVREFGLRSQCL